MKKVDSKTKRKIALIGAFSLFTAALAGTTIALVRTQNSNIQQKGEYKNSRDEYILKLYDLENKFYKIKDFKFNQLLDENKKKELELVETSNVSWKDKTLTYKSKFDELKTLVSEILNEVETKEIQKNESNPTQKDKVKNEMKAYKTIFVEDYLDNQLFKKLNNENGELDFVKAEINNIDNEEKMYSLFYYWVKAAKLNSLYEKYLSIIEENETKKSESVEKLFKDQKAIDNLENIQKEINKLIEKEEEKLQFSPEEKFSLKFDEYWNKEEKIIAELNKQNDLKLQINQMDEEKNVSNQKVKELKEKINKSISILENLLKEYEILFNELNTLIKDIKRFNLHRIEFNHTLESVENMISKFKNFRTEYNNGTVTYNELSNLGEQEIKPIIEELLAI